MARANIYIKTGVFTGTGVAQSITGLGFTPQVVICKVEGQNMVMRTSTMRGDSTAFLTSSNANLSTRISGLTQDGFNVGVAAQSNNNGSNVYWMALAGMSAQQYFRILRYYGDGNDNRNLTGFGFGFTPDLVIIKGDAAVNAPWRSSAMVGDATYRFDANAVAADTIQNVQSNGFQVGTATTANGNTTEYHGFGMKSIPGYMAVGVFTGDGTAAKLIRGLGFNPDVVIVKANAAQMARVLTKEMITNSATSMFAGTTATDATGILTLDTDGFSVGSGASVNGNGVLSEWMAFKVGNINVPLTRLAS